MGGYMTDSVCKIELTEEGVRMAQDIVNTVLPLKDAYLGRDGIYLVFDKEGEDRFKHIFEPNDFLLLASTLGKATQTTEHSIFLSRIMHIDGGPEIKRL